jgi:hypothetical protein
MRVSTIDRLPWRLSWRCPSCDRKNGTPISQQTAVELIAMFEQPGGTLIANRELTDWLIEARDFDERVRIELLDA